MIDVNENLKTAKEMMRNILQELQESMTKQQDQERYLSTADDIVDMRECLQYIAVAQSKLNEGSAKNKNIAVSWLKHVASKVGDMGSFTLADALASSDQRMRKTLEKRSQQYDAVWRLLTDVTAARNALAVNLM